MVATGKDVKSNLQPYQLKQIWSSSSWLCCTTEEQFVFLKSVVSPSFLFCLSRIIPSSCSSMMETPRWCPCGSVAVWRRGELNRWSDVPPPWTGWTFWTLTKGLQVIGLKKKKKMTQRSVSVVCCDTMELTSLGPFSLFRNAQRPSVGLYPQPLFFRFVLIVSGL